MNPFGTSSKLKEAGVESVWDERPEKLLGIGTFFPLSSSSTTAFCFLHLFILMSSEFMETRMGADVFAFLYLQ